jgi:hypothetical protein
MYLNLLSNTLYDPTLKAFGIQMNIGIYGTLSYPAATTASVAFVMLFTLLILNALLPLAVWRLAYERHGQQKRLLRVMGIGAQAYFTAMFTYDLLLQFSLSVFAVGINLVVTNVGAVNSSGYTGAPIFPLVALAFVSSYCIVACAYLLVCLTPSTTESRLLSAMVTCGTVCVSILSVILIAISFPDAGDWPDALSLIPLCAQARY